MAQTSAPISLGYGTPAWDEYTAAQQEARDILAQRNSRLLDPVALAAAQGFFAPTKTGSFGESLGNVAGQMIPAVQAEEKRTMDMAKMRMELAQQGLQTSIQAQNAEQDQAAFNARAYKAPTAQPATPVAGMPPPVAPPAAPAPAPAPQPPSGALAQAVPPPVAPPAAPPSPLAQAAPPVVSPAPQPPPQPAPTQPSGQQLFPAQPTTWDAEETEFASRMRRAGKPMGEIMKEIDEARRKNIIVNERGATNIKTGQVFAPVDPTPTEVRLPDGTTHITTKTMASRLAGAQAAGNADEYFKIVDQIQKGMTRPTPAASTTQGAPVTAPANVPVGRPRTKDEEEAEAAQKKAESTETGKSRVARTSAVLDAVKAAEDTRIIAQSAKDVINQPNSELFMGIFEKPKIKTALAKMVEDTVFAPTNFREAITSMNIALSVPRNPDESTKDYTARKQDVMDRYIEATTLMAQAKFAASLLSKGQGTITDGERKLFADTTINTKMSVGAFNKISDMLIERSKFAEDLGSKLAQNKMQIDDFKQTPEYKKMAREYEGRLSSILRGGRPAASSGGRPDLNAAGANLERQGI